jgi:hypothetical protein
MTWTALNFPSPGCDQQQTPHQAETRGRNFVQTIRPDNSDPIPLRNSPQSMGVIMIRFVGLLVVAVVVLALIWNR